MTFRIAALCSALLLVSTGCPNGNGNGDAGVRPEEDAGMIIPPAGGCTGGCGPNQICDEAARTCISACQPACAANQLCVKQGDAHVCQAAEVSCAGAVCGAGEPACVADQCSCLTFREASRDTCAAQGRICNEPYNTVTMAGGTCQDPILHQACQRECAGGDCGTCPAGTACNDTGFWQGYGYCNRTCEAEADCSREEICNTNDGFCYPKSLFGNVQNTLPGRSCFQARTTDAGTKEYFRVTPGQLCIDTNQSGGTLNATQDFDPTGTCTWLVIQTDTKYDVWATCRPPGPVPVGGTCSTESLQRDHSVNCETGLQCMPVGRGTQGVCAPICNARTLPSGEPGAPGCGVGSTCTDFLRVDTVESIPGACAQTCSVFSSEANHGCAALGSRPTSCVPTNYRGEVTLTGTGAGLCLPQLDTVAAEGQACAETDPMRGAACESGLVCTRVGTDPQPRCVKPCDLECSGATPPDRCATQANATCGSGQTCTVVNSGEAATAGFCL